MAHRPVKLPLLVPSSTPKPRKLKKMGWHWSTVARNKPRTRFRLLVRAGGRLPYRSGNRIEQLMCLKYPGGIVSLILRTRKSQTHVAFPAWLDPDESILEGVASVSGWPDTKSSANDVAPITPLVLLRRLYSISGWISH